MGLNDFVLNQIIQALINRTQKCPIRIELDGKWEIIIGVKEIDRTSQKPSEL